jgi:hypothetical protein
MDRQLTRRELIAALGKAGLVAAGAALARPTETAARRFWALDRTMLPREEHWLTRQWRSEGMMSPAFDRSLDATIVDRDVLRQTLTLEKHGRRVEVTYEFYQALRRQPVIGVVTGFADKSAHALVMTSRNSPARYEMPISDLYANRPGAFQPLSVGDLVAFDPFTGGVRPLSS